MINSLHGKKVIDSSKNDFRSHRNDATMLLIINTQIHRNHILGTSRSIAYNLQKLLVKTLNTDISKSNTMTIII